MNTRALSSLPPVIVVTGPTAVGKSRLAMELAGWLGGEIVSADSRQVYRYMDVGTAKPDIGERASVPHHLVDAVYPDEPYSIADFQAGAERALRSIADRGRVALVVGGSPHYIQALVDRLQPAPRFPALRDWLERADAADPTRRLDAWLRELDPAAAAAIDLRNRRRVLRAIEIILGTGRPFSNVGRQRGELIPALWIGLRLGRATLYDVVARRFSAMLEHGWLEEVRILLAMGYSPSLPSLTATGYADLARVVRGEASLDEATTRILHATHAFIRRQETWLRAEPRVRWLDAADPALAERAFAACSAFVHNGANSTT
jgi:tRNA dimethylallyltransferase